MTPQGESIVDKQQLKKATLVYTIIVALIGLGLGLSDNLFPNYFRDAFEVDAFERGLIEIPRELPGVLTMFILSALAFWGDKKLTLLSFTLNCLGLISLALLRPSFPMMLVFLFVTSLGGHMFIPLFDNLGMSLATKGDYGKMLGRFTAVRTVFMMLAGILAFWGFRSGFFSFTTPFVLIFLIAATLFASALFLTVYLMKLTPSSRPAKSHFVFRKAYGKFYILSALFGGRKQIMFVFGPWVLIELFDFGADYMSLFIILASIVSVLALPVIGRWIDKYGAPRVMVIEVLLFFVIYLGYGLISAGVHSGLLPAAGLIVALIVIIHTLDRVAFNFIIARSVYLRSIAVSPEDVTPTLATGMALDHIFSILSAFICGWLWWEFGPQYVFIFSGVLAAVQLAVAIRID